MAYRRAHPEVQPSPYPDRAQELATQRIDGWGRVLPAGRTAGFYRPDNVADSSGGGQEGYTISISGISGVFAALTVNNSEVVANGNTLLSPTMRPGDPSCLEGTNVINSATIQNFVGFYTFCGSTSLQNDGSNGYYGQLYYTDPNFAAYTSIFNGLKVYTMEIKQFPNGSWHGLLYNYATHLYEDRLDVNGSCGPPPNYSRSNAPGGCNLRGGSPNGGWVMHETHYIEGRPCSPVTEKQAQILETSSGATWTQAPTNPSKFLFHNYRDGAYGGGFYSFGACSAYSQHGTTIPSYALHPSTNSASGYLWDVTTINALSGS